MEETKMNCLFGKNLTGSLKEEFETLQKEFKDIHAEYSPKILEKLSLSKKYLQEAIDLAEESGIPFTYKGLEERSQRYIPQTLMDGKFIGHSNQDMEWGMKRVIEDLTQAWLPRSEYNNGGWYNSSSDC